MPMNPRLLRPLTSGVFDPRRIANLAVWLDFSDGSTLFQVEDGTVPATAASDPVGYIRDKSGNGRHATQLSTGNNRPTIASATFNGRRGLLFDNSNDSLTLGNISAAFGSQQATAFIAWTTNGVADNAYPLLRTRGNFSNLWGTSGSVCQEGSFRAGARLSATWDAGINLSNFTTPKCYTLQASTSVYDLRIDGVIGTTTTPSADWGAGDTYDIGGAQGVFLGGTIFEVILYSRVLPAAERQTVERYLAAKYGFTVA